MSTLGVLKKKADANAPEPAPIFYELDLDKIKKDLNLLKEGQSRGAKNLPQTISETFDDIEHRIITTLEAEQRKQQHSFSSQLNTLHQRIASLDLENEAINIGAAAQRASAEFVVKVDEGKAKLFTLWRNVGMIENQWNDFRKQHRLVYPADYPLSRLWNFAVILVILAVESILNGNFLARGLESGLVGGIIEALVIAAINVGFGFFLGNSVFRYLFHRSYALRAIAFLEVPVSFGVAVFFNLLVGHYRDALNGADPEHASTAAWNHFLADPFSLAALPSWVLFAMGLFFFVVATCDGFKMDDPYPGYGAISRKHEAITQEYTDEKANIIDDLSHTRDLALETINEARQSLAARKAELSGILDQREKLIHHFEAHQAYLNRAANDLLAAYRNANMNARTTPAPAHFNGAYTLPKAMASAMPHAINEGLFDSNIERTNAALKDAIAQVNVRFEQAAGEFHRIEELTKGDHHAPLSTP